MANLLSSRFTPSGKLERWLGTDATERLSSYMKDWYGPPIAVGNVPGSVWACQGGDFKGPIRAGTMSNVADFLEQRVKRIVRNAARRQKTTMNAGFSSLSDLISEANHGKRRDFSFRKQSNTTTTGSVATLWRQASNPPAGAAPAAAPGGTIPVDSSTGAFPFTNPTGGDTQHFVTMRSFIPADGSTLLLYDRLFAVAKTMNSTATEAVTGVPTRYQNTSQGSIDSAEGNFLFIETDTQVSATAHNHTVCTYNDQGGGASTMPSLAGISSAISGRLDMPLRNWFAPLEAGDRGVLALTQMQTDALVTSGALGFCIGHPIAWAGHPLLNALLVVEGINTAHSLVRIFDDASLALLLFDPTGNQPFFLGSFTTVAG